MTSVLLPCILFATPLASVSFPCFPLGTLLQLAESVEVFGESVAKQVQHSNSVSFPGEIPPSWSNVALLPQVGASALSAILCDTRSTFYVSDPISQFCYAKLFSPSIQTNS
ncbi:hypothetical protein BDN72DRAFT_907012 [Pluteus cervinus]|uniref:Uncharacterized protein n=1 Tax=Pluteus cervinus TaxID=181527 RepID=A0ACD2ZXN4_9AGAR|nr:hypothetical protein BDN72DRAFT_907012 [Pluteus cervinus]